MRSNLDQVHAQVAKVYPEVRWVADSTLCFTRQDARQTPFAIYYLDFAEQLPSSAEELRQYVERVVGSQYFVGARSLQWNNYVYFVRDARTLLGRAAQHAKRLIEQERTYARKFVIPDDALESLLRPGFVQPYATAQQIDATSQWAAVLQQPHFVDAVFGNYTLPVRMQILLGQRLPPAARTGGTSDSVGVGSILPAIRRFIIGEYRHCLRGRDFLFGDVNLLFGANGTGKTSILEAIELYYCGKRTRRNPHRLENYRFSVQLDGGDLEAIGPARPEAEFRNRSRLWYGIREQKRSNLYDWFGRFNFLDTDAAVDLARSEDERTQGDLARLLVGSEAAVVWQVIEGLSAEVKGETRRARESLKQTIEDQRLVTEQLARSRTVKTESSSLREALQGALQRSKWTIDDRDLETGAGELIVQLSELLAVSEQLVALSWIEAPVTLEKAQVWTSAAEQFLEDHASSIQKLESLQTRWAQCTTGAARAKEAGVLADELDRLLEAGVERREFDLSSQRAIVAKTSSLLAGIDDGALTILAAAAQDHAARESHRAALHALLQSENLLREAKRASEKFTQARDRSVSLGQQLRELAREIVGEGPGDECPLCHTKLKPGDLTERMSLGVDRHVEAAGQKLLSEVRRLERDHQRLVSTGAALGRLVQYCDAEDLPADVSIGDVHAKIKETFAALNEARRRCNVVAPEIESLRARGMSLRRLNEVRTQLGALGFGGAHDSPDEVRALRRSIKDEVREASIAVESAAKALAELQASLRAALEPWRASTSDPRAALAEIKERRVATLGIYSRLANLLSRFPWPKSRPVGEWIVEAQAVRGIAGKLQTALGTERVAVQTVAEATSRHDQLVAKRKEMSNRIERLDSANTALQEIVEKHSLEILTRSALLENRESIDKVFGQIHAPAEFDRIDVQGERWMLRRKGKNEMVPLTQISTGQRAAFALSVFLAQNAQLQAGPPVILIDDPIAHVDDLNGLAFLDYLREVSLSGTRQIFFATASDKLASLFERKFDFLGERFRRFDLTGEKDE